MIENCVTSITWDLIRLKVASRAVPETCRSSSIGDHLEMLLNLREARVEIADWRQHDNRERPHSRLGYLSPEGFLANQEVSP